MDYLYLPLFVCVYISIYEKVTETTEWRVGEWVLCQSFSGEGRHGLTWISTLKEKLSTFQHSTP
jgi:hypothetical protein